MIKMFPIALCCFILVSCSEKVPDYDYERLLSKVQNVKDIKAVSSDWIRFACGEIKRREGEKLEVARKSGSFYSPPPAQSVCLQVR